MCGIISPEHDISGLTTSQSHMISDIAEVIAIAILACCIISFDGILTFLQSNGTCVLKETDNNFLPLCLVSL